MTKKVSNQLGLLKETPAEITTGKTGEPGAELEIIDDSPEKPSADLRKFNRAAAEVAKAVNPLKLILKISDLAGVDSALLHMKAAAAVKTLIENKRKALVGPWNEEVKRINDHAKTLVKDVDPEIIRVKGLVIDFQKAEELRVKRERTNTRGTQLLSLGMIPQTSEKDGKKFISSWTNPEEQLITQYQVEESTDAQWSDLLLNQSQERVSKATEKLEKQLESADFFGEDTTPIKDKIEVTKLASSFLGSLAETSTPVATKIKGATKTWTFELTDLSQVPREYLQVDEVKIRQAIAAGTRAIAGVRIFQKDSISLR